MALYAADKLIAQARALAAEYRRAMGKPLPGVGSEVAEHDARRLLSLEPAPDDAGGYDAVDPARGGKRIQIKSRLLAGDARSSPRIGRIRLEQAWDSVVLVLLDEDYQPTEILELDRDELLEYIDRSSSRRARRGVLSVARFRAIGRLLWTPENGREGELWVNQ